MHAGSLEALRVTRPEAVDLEKIKKGVGVGDRIVLEGIRQVCDGEKVEYEFRLPDEVMRKLRNHAE
jgi:membrane fusion protein (multidrug efflux system)